MECDRNTCYSQEYNGGCETCPCNEPVEEIRTNYDDIVSFTIDEMAKFLANLAGGGKAREKAFKAWLEEEAE